MASIVVSALNLTTALVAGGNYVRIDGSGFQEPFAPAAEGVTSELPPSMGVWFGKVPSPQVLVASPTQLYARVPQHAAGTVDLRLANLQLNGQEVPGEYKVLANAFTFKRRDLSSAGKEPPLMRVVRALRQLLSQQVLAETVMITHTDYDQSPGDGLNIVEVSKVPALLLVGPNIKEDRFYSENELRTAPGPDGRMIELEPAYVVSVTFSVSCIADATTELLRIEQDYTSTIHRNKHLFVPRDETNEAAGFDKYELDFVDGGDMPVVSAPGLSNIRQFNGGIMLRGVPLDDPDVELAPGLLSTEARNIVTQLGDYIPPGGLTPEQTKRPARPAILWSIKQKA